MTIKCPTPVTRWFRRWPKINAQTRNVLQLFAVILLSISLVFSFKDLYNNAGTTPQPMTSSALGTFARTLLMVGLALLLSMLTIFIAAILRGMPKGDRAERILSKILSSNKTLVFTLLLLLLLVPLGPIAVLLVRDDPLFPKHVAEYVREALSSVMLTVLFFVTPGMFAWLATDRSANYINTASKQEVELLPGVGSTIAQRIIENRPFRRVEDLKEVPGIGEKIFSQIQDKLESGEL